MTDKLGLSFVILGRRKIGSLVEQNAENHSLLRSAASYSTFSRCPVSGFGARTPTKPGFRELARHCRNLKRNGRFDAQSPPTSFGIRHSIRPSGFHLTILANEALKKLSTGTQRPNLSRASLSAFRLPTSRQASDVCGRSGRSLFLRSKAN